MCKSIVTLIAWGVVSLILCIGFIVLAYFFPSILQNALTQQILAQRLYNVNGTQGYNQWQSSTFPNAPPYYFYVYAYNITNVEEVLNGAAPKLQEVGPYVYIWKWYMFDIEYLDGGNSVEFFKFESFTFNRNLTASNLDPFKDNCTFPSIAYAGFRSKLGTTGSDYWFQALGIDIFSTKASLNSFPDTGPFITTSVHNYVFSYDSGLLEWANQTLGSLVPINPIVTLQPSDTSEEETRQRLNYQKDGMRTGVNNNAELNVYYKFRGQTKLSLWGSEEANTIKGTDGLGFPIFIQGSPDFLVFVDNLYRHVNFVSNETYEVKGVNTNVYFLDVNEFQNYSGNPYYLNAPPGVSNLTAVEIVEQGIAVPILLSQPHFFSADPYYASQVEFLPPNNVTDLFKHNTFLYVEPRTGLTIKANKRLQVNVQVGPSFVLYPKLKKTFIPAVWFEETSEITDDQANQLKTIDVVLEWKEYAPVILFCLGGIFLLVCGSLFFRAYTLNQQKREGYGPINDDERR